LFKTEVIIILFLSFYSVLTSVYLVILGVETIVALNHI